VVIYELELLVNIFTIKWNYVIYFYLFIFFSPSGQVWYSDPIVDFASGDTLFGEIKTVDNGDSYSILSATEKSATTLTVETKGLTFDWADVTLEVYSVTSCDLFPRDSIVFSNLTIQASGGQVITPKWDLYEGKTCTEAVKVVDDSTVEIVAVSATV
jgi:hypothetical protein